MSNTKTAKKQAPKNAPKQNDETIEEVRFVVKKVFHDSAGRVSTFKVAVEGAPDALPFGPRDVITVKVQK